jgi:hypothetical protein
VTGAVTALKKIAGARKFLLVGDSKLISYDNVAAIGGARCTFLAPASKNYVSPAELAACDLAKAAEAGDVAGRDQHKKNTGQLGRWYVLEDDQPFWIRNSRRKSDPPIRLRRIFVHSTARAGAARTSRTRKLTRARDDLGRLVPGLGGRFYPASRSRPTVSSRSASPARLVLTCAAPSAPPRPATPAAPGPARAATGRPAPPRRPGPARPAPGRAAAGPANPPSPGGSTSRHASWNCSASTRPTRRDTNPGHGT